MYFLDTPISDELLAVAESHRFNTAETQILLCCDEAQPGLTGVMTEGEALAYVRENEETWRMAGVPQGPLPGE